MARALMDKRAFAHVFFLDGVGLGGPDPDENPFVSARLPVLTGLLGDGWYLNGRGRLQTERATLIATVASRGIVGRPRCAAGQATILTGRNCPRQVGELCGPNPSAAVGEAFRQGTLFHEVTTAGGRAALIPPY